MRSDILVFSSFLTMFSDVHIVTLKCLFTAHLTVFFGKVGGIASEDVIIQLVKSKCMPAMLYGLDVCNINKSQIKFLQYAVTGMLMKVFKTKSKNIIQDCALYFNFLPVDQYILKRQYNFLFKFANHPPSFLSGLFNQGARIHMEAVSARLSTYYDHN